MIHFLRDQNGLFVSPLNRQNLRLFFRSPRTLSFHLILLHSSFYFHFNFHFHFADHDIFVNAFGRAGKFSIKDTKSNLRRCSLTDGSRHDSFHLSLTLKERRKEGRKEDRWLLPEVCSFWWEPPSLFAG
jgi:hypothetical protein